MSANNTSARTTPTVLLILARMSKQILMLKLMPL